MAEALYQGAISYSLIGLADAAARLFGIEPRRINFITPRDKIILNFFLCRGSIVNYFWRRIIATVYIP